MEECKVCGYEGPFSLQYFVKNSNIHLTHSEYNGDITGLESEDNRDFFECCPNCHIVYFGALDI